MKNSEIPKMIYGTAWKEELTQACVVDALRAGFRAIDTANQRKHYFEAGVGQGLQVGYKELGIRREDLFLQTKFTYAGGQDHRKPYDEDASFTDQVRQSFASSLEHLQTDYLDSYLLHGPSTGVGLTHADFETWSEIEELYLNNKVKHIGVSNFRLEQLIELYEKSRVKPSFIQNRCFAETQWDFAVREFCKQKNIFYQGFSLLTANWQFIGGEVIRPEGRNIPHLVFATENNPSAIKNTNNQLAPIQAKYGVSLQQVIFRFTQQVGMIPITGTRSFEHMKMDQNIEHFSLTPDEINIVERIAFVRKSNLTH